ncbi:hypothetical protein GUJ93_ZPchr0008g13158 [Zizania palustris]|uniref:Uncharacterized protein n=1 Tax=Zizania palustris TaxID=103762 RepID=A0A8J5VI65_ZIZPA|nr:hypothetical protein GUJ93_ZPchr0008g13158 [Zizania palustris]
MTSEIPYVATRSHTLIDSLGEMKLTPLDKLVDVQAEQVIHTPHTPNVATVASPGGLEEFIDAITTALPQALLPTPPKKLASLFKKPLTPSATRAIRELVTAGSGKNLLMKPMTSAAAPASTQAGVFQA